MRIDPRSEFARMALEVRSLLTNAHEKYGDKWREDMRGSMFADVEHTIDTHIALKLAIAKDAADKSDKDAVIDALNEAVGYIAVLRAKIALQIELLGQNQGGGGR
jgi:hypothetical protein